MEVWHISIISIIIVIIIIVSIIVVIVVIIVIVISIIVIIIIVIIVSIIVVIVSISIIIVVIVVIVTRLDCLFLVLSSAGTLYLFALRSSQSIRKTIPQSTLDAFLIRVVRAIKVSWLLFSFLCSGWRQP